MLSKTFTFNILPFLFSHLKWKIKLQQSFGLLHFLSLFLIIMLSKHLLKGCFLLVIEANAYECCKFT